MQTEIDGKCIWAAGEGVLNWGKRAGGKYMYGHVYCLFPGCTCAAKCTVLTDPELNRGANVKVAVYGYGVRNHKAFLEQEIVARLPIRSAEREVSAFQEIQNISKYCNVAERRIFVPFNAQKFIVALIKSAAFAGCLR